MNKQDLDLYRARLMAAFDGMAEDNIPSLVNFAETHAREAPRTNPLARPVMRLVSGGS
jgi:hypothetical protein